MGLNFVAVCHRHRVQTFIFRGHEHEGLHRFFREHEECSRWVGWDSVRVYTDGGAADPPAEVLAGYTENSFPLESERPSVVPIEGGAWGGAGVVRLPDVDSLDG